MNLKGTETEKNLAAAFGGESIARNKYTFFAEEARKEKHDEVGELFEKMAKNESIHGKLLYKALYGKIGNSFENLNNAMNGEFGEWSTMYPDFAKKAEEEGFADIAEMFRRIAAIEKDHEHRFLMALTELAKAGNKQAPAENHTQAVTLPGYRCMFCGATYENHMDVCSLCGAIGSFEPTQIHKQMN